MIRLKITIAALLLLILTAQAQDTLKVLFLGNSYTGNNNLSLLFADLSASGGKPTFIDSYPPGGYWLEDHLQDPRSTGRIAQGIWDYVVLQEQSQVPVIDYWRYNSMYPSAESLDSVITSYGGNTAFFMTWGREYGGQQSIGGYSSPVFEDFFHMQDSLASAYTEISEMLSAALCPAGLSWATAVTLNPEIELWAPDEAHPSLMGSYLTACTFYGVFFEESPVGLSYTAGLAPEDAEFLQNAAYLTLGTAAPDKVEIPASFTVINNYPNPFNSSTLIQFSLEKDSFVELRLFNNLGREVQNLISDNLNRGLHRIQFSADGLASGIYFAHLQTTGQSETIILELIK